MSNPFFDRPILNSPYGYPDRHWELDKEGQPTQQIIELRRKADFITPIPKPKKRKGNSAQDEMVFDEGQGLSSKEQQYDQTSIVNEVRGHVNAWRALPPAQWGVTPETARLLQHWRHHDFHGVRPFFCQVEAVETAIWLTEVAPLSKSGKRLLEHLEGANRDANPEVNSASHSSSPRGPEKPPLWLCSSPGKPSMPCAALGASNSHAGSSSWHPV
jgi:type III restriction enzyme